MTKAFLLGFIAGQIEGASPATNPYYPTKAGHAEWWRGYFCSQDAIDNPMQDIMTFGEESK